ncbi:MAG: alpha/beta hydrolase-fold protein [Bacteroidota bacterium]|nr:alpha/beta hydrolase-fold protein [Bacteroidota bacterium]
MIFQENHISTRYCGIILLMILSLSTLSAQTFTQFIQRLQKLSPAQRSGSVKKFFSVHHNTPIIEQDSLLHFVFYGKAGSVGVNGNLQHWNAPDELIKIECSDSAFYYRTFIAPSNARLDYQLVVDGKYQTDPRNPRITPSGFGPHSEVRMPKFVPSPYLIHRDSIPHGTIINAGLNNHILPPLQKYSIGGRNIKIYLPPGYESLSRLPAVYVHDGLEAIDFALMPTIIDNLIAEKRIPPVIAVFIPPVQRGDEYMGIHVDRFVKLISDVLVPAIDKQYKTERSPLKRAMIGISAGGHISLYTVINRPDVFLNVGGQSSAITPQLRALTKQRADENTFSLSMKIYLDCGRYDINNGFGNFLQMHRNYSDLLSSLRIPHYYREVNDGHEWANWREHIPEMLIYFFGR